VLHYSSVSPVLVGRDAQVEALATARRMVSDGGSARMVLLAGPAGMGKSRLVAEAHRLAAESAMSRLEGSCVPDAGVPYVALVSALRRRTRAMGAEELAALFSGPASLAAALLPEVAELTGLGTTSRPPEDLFAATWHVLARLSRPAGALLVLEDLHWADAGTLRFLAYLARETDGLPLWVVGTYRSDEMHRRHPLSVLLADLARERRFDALPVAPLDPTQVRSMLSALFDGSEVSQEFAEAVADRTEGNPFFIEELVKVLVERGDLYRLGSQWERRELDEIEMPLSVRETLLARARTMPTQWVAVLQLAAVAGGQLDTDILARAGDVPADVVDDTVREGLARGILLERRDGAATTYAFRHALSREAFADELVGPDRRRAHLRIGRALEEVHSGHLDAVSAAIADHFAAAHEESAAVEYTLRAARYATSMISVDQADHLYDQTLHMMAPDDPRRLAVTLEAVGTSNSRLSPMKVAFADDARRMAHEQGDPKAETNALMAIAGYRWLDGRGQEGIALIREALELVHGRDDALEARVLARLSRTRALADDLEPDDPIIAAGIELARRSGSALALSTLRGTQMLLETDPEVFDLRYTEGLLAAREAGELEGEGNIHINRGYISLWNGRFGAAFEALGRGISVFEQIAPSDEYGHAGLAWLASLTGDYDQALALAQPLGPRRVRPIGPWRSVPSSKSTCAEACRGRPRWSTSCGTSPPGWARRSDRCLRARHEPDTCSAPTVWTPPCRCSGR
jgi:hypothetical protein